MKTLAQQIYGNMNKRPVNENDMTGEEFMDYWDNIGDLIEDIKFTELKKYFPGMPRYAGDAKKLIMAGIAHVGAWVRGAAASAADDDPEGYDYDGEYIESLITSRDPDEWRMIIDDMWNDDDYEKLANKLADDDVVKWFEGEFCPVFFANWFEKTAGSMYESVAGSRRQIREARGIEYHVAINDVTDSEGIPVTVSIIVDREYQKVFEKWLEAEEGNTFANAEGGNIEY